MFPLVAQIINGIVVGDNFLLDVSYEHHDKNRCCTKRLFKRANGGSICSIFPPDSIAQTLTLNIKSKLLVPLHLT